MFVTAVVVVVVVVVVVLVVVLVVTDFNKQYPSRGGEKQTNDRTRTNNQSVHLANIKSFLSKLVLVVVTPKPHHTTQHSIIINTHSFATTIQPCVPSPVLPLLSPTLPYPTQPFPCPVLHCCPGRHSTTAGPSLPWHPCTVAAGCQGSSR